MQRMNADCPDRRVQAPLHAPHIRAGLTPYLLARINELTGGRSLKANIALVKNNAALAAQVAVEYAALSKT